MVAALQAVLCERCHRPIADWDGERLTVRRSGGGTPVYIEIPGPRALIQCAHMAGKGGRMARCGHNNRVIMAV